MARLNATQIRELSSSRETPPAPRTRHRPSNVTPPSPTPSASSDKENQYQPSRANTSMEHAAKRRRTGDQNGTTARQAPSSRVDANPDLQFYDPNQNIEERRQVRKGLRELNKEAVDLRQEWLAPQSTGLRDAVVRADALFTSVKQTSDATIDSRLLVTAGDLAYKKTQHITLGDGAQGIDVDEFVSKCIGFMNRAGGGPGSDENRPSNTQRQRRRRATQANDSDDEDEQGPDAGDALNWEWLGARACFPSNSRPATPGFLLGPLSLQKRARAQRARRERLQRQGRGEAVRPDELKAADLQQAESSTLTAICTKIHDNFKSVLLRGWAKVAEESSEDPEQEEVQRLCEKHFITEKDGVHLFRFALHPTSFGQTVENLFYVSFLIKDGHLGVDMDNYGMPTLREFSPTSPTSHLPVLPPPPNPPIQQLTSHNRQRKRRRRSNLRNTKATTHEPRHPAPSSLQPRL